MSNRDDNAKDDDQDIYYDLGTVQKVASLNIMD